MTLVLAYTVYTSDAQNRKCWPWTAHWSLTWLLHVSNDPIKGHFSSHVPSVVHRLPAGLQGKAHLCQLHHRGLIYFWSWGTRQRKKTCTVCMESSHKKNSHVYSLIGSHYRDSENKLSRESHGECTALKYLHWNKVQLIPMQHEHWIFFGRCLFNY